MLHPAGAMKVLPAIVVLGVSEASVSAGGVTAGCTDFCASAGGGAAAGGASASTGGFFAHATDNASRATNLKERMRAPIALIAAKVDHFGGALFQVDVIEPGGPGFTGGNTQLDR